MNLSRFLDIALFEEFVGGQTCLLTSKAENKQPLR
jgi:hypothetical protein